MVRKLLFLLSIPLLANITPEYLQIEATLFPKIVLLDKAHSQKIKDKTILFYILHDPKYEQKSRILATYLKRQQLHDYRIDARTFTHLPKTLPTAYIVFSDNPRKFYDKLKQKERIVFCVKKDQIADCAVTITIEGRVFPLINPRVIKELGLAFEPILYKVSRFHED